MIRQAVGVANGLGSQTRTYHEGEELSNSEDWEQARNANFIQRGLAEETKVVKPTETKATTPTRARNADGTLIGDDPSTPDVNEAWESGKAPSKKGKSN
tara:strand:- start:8740 stop:9036 length:297 start_codon:yes stop_codon:yes gene_type:complete